MQQAVIQTGGKQYLVAPKDKVTVEKLEAEAGSTITFDQVLLTDKDGAISVGKPFLAGAKVTGKVLAQQRGEKLVVFKYRAKSRYRRKTGHRQSETVVEIESIA
ncbi:MAG TPA: 50S ribosomal protein L21 [Methylomirabilota bacterium]|nr:50S ribosomal protein L21 [Methylomirabilota bacterium]